MINLCESPKGKGAYKKIYPAEYQNAIILDCEKNKVTIIDVENAMNKAIDEKRPLIVEDIKKLII